MWHPETGRIGKIVVKLAQGHAAYELYPLLDEPTHVDFRPLGCLSDADRNAFETPSLGGNQPSPEIGTRAFLRIWVGLGNVCENSDWVVVQPGRYRYAVNETGSVTVRMVLSEYLACTVAWG